VIQQLADVLDRLRAANREASEPHRAEFLGLACRELEQILAEHRGGHLAEDPKLCERLANVMQWITEAEVLNGNHSIPDSIQLMPNRMFSWDELVNWAKGQFTEQEVAAGLREIRETGGLEFKDFVHELEEAAADE
jgi:hypothetical protein